MTALVLGSVGLMLLAQTGREPATGGGRRASPQPHQERKLTMSDTHKVHAVGRTTVKTYQPTVFDEVPGAPTLSDIHLTETFSGDIEGEGLAHVVQAAPAGGAASFAGIERVRGSIGGKRGSFLLQVHGTVVAKQMKAEWFVVPDSGSGGLKGLRGEGGFNAELGHHGSIWLDYQINAP